MRWLKSYSVFESKDLEQIKDLIEDLFTEVTDKWEIKKIPSNRVASDFMTGVSDDTLYYHVGDCFGGISFRIYQRAFYTGNVEPGKSIDFNEVVNDSRKVIERIKRFNLEYDISFNSSMVQNPYNYSLLNTFILKLVKIDTEELDRRKLLKFTQPISESVEGCDYLGYDYRRRRDELTRKYKREKLNSRDCLLMDKLLKSDENNDFFNVSYSKDKSTIKFYWMHPKIKHSPIRVETIKLEDDYYYIWIRSLFPDESKYSNIKSNQDPPRSRCYLVDSLESLGDFIKNISDESKYFIVNK